MPELERLMLHRLAEVDAVVREAYADFDYKTVVAALSNFMNTDLSAFYFDIRKDALYCEPPSSLTRKAALTTVDILCDAILKWLAPILCFTTDEAWMNYRAHDKASVHLQPSREGSTASATMRWRKSGRPSATCAASSPARWNWSAPPNGSVPRWRRHPWSM